MSPDRASRDYQVLAWGADPSGQDDSHYAIQATLLGGGDIPLPPGTFMVNKPLDLVPGTKLSGRGAPTTCIVPGPALIASGGSVLRRISASSSDQITDICLSDLLIDASASGPGGSLDGIHFDSSISEAVVYRSVEINRVHVRGARLAFLHDANNVNGGEMNNELSVVDCIAEASLIGFIATGTYAASYERCFAFGNTVAGWGTGGVTPNCPAVTGVGPTTLTRLRGCHVEGLGNVDGSGTATEQGIYISGSDLQVSDIVASNVSQRAVAIGTDEGFATLIDGITAWGSGYAGIFLMGAAGQHGTLGRFSLYSCSQSSDLTTGGPVGPQGALEIQGGDWDIVDGWCPTETDAPAYAVTWGDGGSDSYGRINIERYHCPNPKTAYGHQFNSQSGLITFRDCQGLTPTQVSPVTGAALTPSVPAASAVVTNTTGVDVDVFIAGGAAVTVSINGVSTELSSGSFALRSGSTVSLGAYTTAPTWVWVGR